MANKFSVDKYSPALFDVTQDIISSLPLRLIKQCLLSEQTQEVALQILEPYKVKGYSVSSDSAGLTKLTRTIWKAVFECCN
ncbi:hypothetical protein [uncultured Nostoc sp.]|uniref:hypothetical protein n=1 Tax=uncultured Nostoc sp. TaxID=340711 RepID=UPI0035CA5FAF